MFQALLRKGTNRKGYVSEGKEITVHTYREEDCVLTVWDLQIPKGMRILC